MTFSIRKISNGYIVVGGTVPTMGSSGEQFFATLPEACAYITAAFAQ